MRASFKAHVGIRALLTLLHNNEPLPFGAVVSRDDDGAGSIVAEDGQVYLSGLAPKGVLKVQWGDDTASTCSAKYELPKEAENSPITKATVICR